MILRITISVLVLVEGLCQLHILVHENDGEDLPGPVCLVALCLVEVQTGMETYFTCESSSCYRSDPFKPPFKTGIVSATCFCND